MLHATGAKNMDRVYERMKQYGSRMEVISIRDLEKHKAIEALQQLRKKSQYAEPAKNDPIYEEIYDFVGGRLAFLSKVAKAKDMLQECRDICETRIEITSIRDPNCFMRS